MDDFEELLRRFRPAGPPAALRQRLVAAAQHEREGTAVRAARDWIPAAAIVLTMIFYWLAANERRMVGAMFTPVPPIDQAAADLVDSEEPLP
jgi:hypothetical protein